MRADDAVTGNDDSDVVAAIGGGDGADSLCIPETTGKFQIAEGLAKRDGGEFAPNALLENGTILVDRKFEDPPLPLEILNKLFNALDHER